MNISSFLLGVSKLRYTSCLISWDISPRLVPFLNISNILFTTLSLKGFTPLSVKFPIFLVNTLVGTQLPAAFCTNIYTAPFWAFFKKLSPAYLIYWSSTPLINLWPSFSEITPNIIGLLLSVLNSPIVLYSWVLPILPPALKSTLLVIESLTIPFLRFLTLSNISLLRVINESKLGSASKAVSTAESMPITFLLPALSFAIIWIWKSSQPLLSGENSPPILTSKVTSVPGKKLSLSFIASQSTSASLASNDLAFTRFPPSFTIIKEEFPCLSTTLIISYCHIIASIAPVLVGLSSMVKSSGSVPGGYSMTSTVSPSCFLNLLADFLNFCW